MSIIMNGIYIKVSMIINNIEHAYNKLRCNICHNENKIILNTLNNIESISNYKLLNPFELIYLIFKRYIFINIIQVKNLLIN